MYIEKYQEKKKQNIKISVDMFGSKSKNCFKYSKNKRKKHREQTE